MKTTSLNAWHRAHGASMAEFGGYEMPLWYPSGARDEHLAVLTAVGLFDTSHMAALLVTGPGAFDLLQRCHTRDLGACLEAPALPLDPGRCLYGVFLHEDGGVLDDAIVYPFAPEVYLAVVNAGMGAAVAEHLRRHRGALEAEVEDLTDRLGKIDVQGPAAAKVLRSVLAEPEEIFSGMEYFTFKGNFRVGAPRSEAVHLTDGTPVLLSRTGYTGEFGFELYVDGRHAVSVWEALFAAGKDFDLKSCGLAARDSLRAGAVLPLSHQDIGPWPFLHHPWSFALPYTSDRRGFSKDFVGRTALERVTNPEHTYPFVGFDVRKVSVHDGGAQVLDSSGEAIGTVLSCVSEMGIGRQGDRIWSVASPDRPDDFVPHGLACGFVRVRWVLGPGEVVRLRDPKREIPAEIVRDIRPSRTARVPIRDMLR
ncbi:MAG: aminomethyl transferase family protein [Deltaproteobacteria bacterium]|nr:aminomethyl transferase family protein [Deltaproteobacteria bacterium]